MEAEAPNAGTEGQGKGSGGEEGLSSENVEEATEEITEEQLKEAYRIKETMKGLITDIHSRDAAKQAQKKLIEEHEAARKLAFAYAEERRAMKKKAEMDLIAVDLTKSMEEQEMDSIKRRLADLEASGRIEAGRSSKYVSREMMLRVIEEAELEDKDTCALDAAAAYHTNNAFMERTKGLPAHKTDNITKSQEQFSSLLSMFAKADSDHSGSIEIKELALVLKRLNAEHGKKNSHEKNLAHAAALLKRWDIDHSGGLDFDEYVMMMVCDESVKFAVSDSQATQLMMLVSREPEFARAIQKTVYDHVEMDVKIREQRRNIE